MGLRELCQNHVPFFFFFLVITASGNNAEKISFNWDFCLRICSFFTKVKRVALRCKIIADRLQLFLLNSFSLKPLASKLTSLKWWSILQGPVWLSLGLHFTSWPPLCGVGVGTELSALRLKLLPLLEKTWTVPKKGRKGPSPGIPWQSSSNPRPTDFGRGSCVQPSFAASVCSGPKALFCSVMWASWQPTPEAATGIGSKMGLEELLPQQWDCPCLSPGRTLVYSVPLPGSSHSPQDLISARNNKQQKFQSYKPPVLKRGLCQGSISHSSCKVETCKVPIRVPPNMEHTHNAILFGHKKEGRTTWMNHWKYDKWKKKHTKDEDCVTLSIGNIQNRLIHRDAKQVEITRHWKREGWRFTGLLYRISVSGNGKVVETVVMGVQHCEWIPLNCTSKK